MDTEEWNRPSAVPDPVAVPTNEGLWRAASEGRLELQMCSECGTHRYPPGATCWRCGSLEWQSSVLPGTGTIYSYSWVPDRARSAEAGREVVYNVAIVELDGVVGGPLRMMSSVVDAWAQGDIEVGSAVEMVGIPVSDGVALPCFRRAG